MFLIKVAPLVKIPRPSPQFLTYFTSEKLKRGSLVLVPLRKRKVKAIVFSQKRAIDLKLEIKKTDYKLKPIIKVIEEKPIITEPQIELAKWIADYYWASFGKTLSLFIKTEPQNKTKKEEQKKSPPEKLIIAPNNFFPEKEIKKVLSQNKQVLILVPEKTKEKYWKEKFKNLNKENNLIIGTRSKLFLPFSSLGLIVLTEEGNKNYKSQMEPKYNTKDVAQKLAKIWQAKLIIVSSLPSTETYYNITNRKIIKSQEKIQKNIIDMRQIKPWKPISDTLASEIKKTLKNNKKAILFINRKGTATALFCRDCGWIQKCKDCDLPLTYHLEKEKPKLICHYCAKEYEIPRLCKKCQSWNLKTLGLGIQKVEKELKHLFPDKKIFRLDSKLAKTQKDQEKIIENFLKSRSSILLTTSLFLKFPIFEKISLVSIVSIDALLSQPDFKIEEEVARKIDMLLSLTKEKFIVQTFFPESKAITWVKKDKEFFYKNSLNERKKFSYPPFSEIIKISIFEKKREKAIKEAFQLKEKIKETSEKYKIKKEFSILGPSPAFIEKIKNKYQWKIILKSKIQDLKLRNSLLSKIPPNWKVDINPERII